jgi:hypothetical protein
MSNPRIFQYFKTSPEIIRLAVMMYVRTRFRSATQRTYCTSAALISPMKPSGSGGTVLVRVLPPRSAVVGFRRCGPFDIGFDTAGGTSAKSS